MSDDVEAQPLLVDTAALIWWHADSPQLTRRARSAMLQSLSRPVHVSAVTAFEITTKVRLGKLRVPASLTTEFAYTVQNDGFRVLDLTASAAAHAGALPGAHRDPFDRLLAAQALALGAMVISPDAAFAEFGVQRCW